MCNRTLESPRRGYLPECLGKKIGFKAWVTDHNFRFWQFGQKYACSVLTRILVAEWQWTEVTDQIFGEWQVGLKQS